VTPLDLRRLGCVRRDWVVTFWDGEKGRGGWDRSKEVK
jgi:hypothetical protein